MESVGTSLKLIVFLAFTYCVHSQLEAEVKFEKRLDATIREMAINPFVIRLVRTIESELNGFPVATVACYGTGSFVPDNELPDTERPQRRSSDSDEGNTAELVKRPIKQLALCMILKHHFNVSDDQAFMRDPLWKPTEIALIQKHRFNIDDVYTNCDRPATPGKVKTIVYMPWLPAWFNDYLLHANWNIQLSNLIYLGSDMKFWLKERKVPDPNSVRPPRWTPKNFAGWDYLFSKDLIKSFDLEKEDLMQTMYTFQIDEPLPDMTEVMEIAEKKLIARDELRKLLHTARTLPREQFIELFEALDSDDMPPIRTLITYGIQHFIGHGDIYNMNLMRLAFAFGLKEALKLRNFIVVENGLSENERYILENADVIVVRFDRMARQASDQGRTLFYIVSPDNETIFYEQLLESNWNADLLRRIDILGRDVRSFGQRKPAFYEYFQLWKYALSAGIAIEVETVDPDFYETYYIFNCENKTLPSVSEVMEINRQQTRRRSRASSSFDTVQPAEMEELSGAMQVLPMPSASSPRLPLCCRARRCPVVQCGTTGCTCPFPQR